MSVSDIFSRKFGSSDNNLGKEGKNMNVYDISRDLAKAIRESHEFALMKDQKVKLDAEPDAKQMVSDFMRISQEVNILQLQKKDVPSDLKEQLEGLQRLIQGNYTAANYLSTMIRFQMMMKDVMDNIQDVIKEVTD